MQPKFAKDLKVGRVVIVSHLHFNKLGILLSMKTVINKDTICRVLVLDHQFKSNDKQVSSTADTN